MIDLLSTSNAPLSGWCTKPRGQMAEEMGLSRQAVITIVQKLVKSGLVEVSESDYLRTTKLWKDAILACKVSLQEGVNKLDTLSTNLTPEPCQETVQGVKKLDTPCQETLQEGVKKLDTYNKRDNNIYNKISLSPESADAEKNQIDDLPADLPLTPPSSGPPPAFPDPPDEIDQIDEAERERIDYTKKLQTDRRVIEGLSRLHKIKGDDALDWIERYVTTQWAASNLKGRTDSDLRKHCLSWIKTQLEISQDREQRQRPRNLSPTGTGSYRRSPDSAKNPTGAAHADRYGSADYASAFALVDALAAAGGINGRPDGPGSDEQTD